MIWIAGFIVASFGLALFVIYVQGGKIRQMEWGQMNEDDFNAIAEAMEGVEQLKRIGTPP